MITVKQSTDRFFPVLYRKNYCATLAMPCQAEYTKSQQEIMLELAQNNFHQNGATFVIDEENFTPEFWDSLVEAFGGIQRVHYV